MFPGEIPVTVAARLTWILCAAAAADVADVTGESPVRAVNCARFAQVLVFGGFDGERILGAAVEELIDELPV